MTPLSSQSGNDHSANRYARTCTTEFWQQVFAAEAAYLLDFLKPGWRVLSVGCGPAHIETRLAEAGVDVVGLDVSRQAIACAPDSLRAVAGSAEELPFADASFDAVIAVASLQFMAHPRRALQQMVRVLRPQGILVAMLLNPASSFFRAKMDAPDSYVHRIRHTDLLSIESDAAFHFQELRSEYFLGIDPDSHVFADHSPSTAALYVIRGVKGSNLPQAF